MRGRVPPEPPIPDAGRCLLEELNERIIGWDEADDRPEQARHAQELYDAGDHTVQQIANLLKTPRSTIYGHLNKESIGRKPPTT